MVNEGVLNVEEARTIPEGSHDGIIKDVTIETRKDQKSKESFKYVDLHVILDDAPDITLKAGVPAKITEKTGLGQLLTRFGAKVGEENIGKAIDVIAVLKNKRIRCTTQDETNERGTFARVNIASIVPLPK